MKQHLLIIIICLITVTSCKSKKHTRHIDFKAKSIAASENQLDLLFSNIKKIDHQSDTHFFIPINENENLELYVKDSGLNVRNAAIMHNKTESTTNEESVLKGHKKEKKEEEQTVKVIDNEEEEVKAEDGYNRVFVLLLFIVSIIILTRKA